MQCANRLGMYKEIVFQCLDNIECGFGLHRNEYMWHKEVSKGIVFGIKYMIY